MGRIPINRSKPEEEDAIMKKCIALIIALTLFPMASLADDYYVYVNWNPGIGYTTGINGYVDEFGYIEGMPGSEYLFVVGGPDYCGNHTAYVYRVETDGDPDIHPNNPEAPGPIATRTFTEVNSHFLGNFCSGHENAFYIDDTGIYYGSAPGWGGIYHWDFDWNPDGWVVSGGISRAQTLARNPFTGDWWLGDAYRNLYEWDGSSWAFQFTHPNLGGSHHDGMEIIGNALFISDMTTDVIIQYCLDDDGNLLDPPDTPRNRFTYSAGPPVEGMGYGPNKHIWISGWNSGTIYELGGGPIQRWLEGIPDQCILPGRAFDSFDLDDYTAPTCGTPPFTYSWSGNVNLSISIDAENIITITYPGGWHGSEVVTFTLTDSEGRTASDDVTYTVGTDNDDDEIMVEGGECGPVDCDDTDPNVGANLDADLDGFIAEACGGDDCVDDPTDDPSICSTCTCGDTWCGFCAKCIHPGAAEGPCCGLTCFDGVDNDCDGLTDKFNDPDCSLLPDDYTPSAEAAVYGPGTVMGSGALAQVGLFLIPVAQILLLRRFFRKKR
jgi:hypothetical protein